MGTTRGGCTRRALLGAGLTVGLTIGCTAESGSESTPTPTGPPIYDGPGLPQLVVEKRFTGSNVKLTQVFRATLVRDTLVLAGRDGDDGGAEAAFVSGNGKLRWEIEPPGELTVDSGRAALLGSDGWAIDDGRDGVVLERYVVHRGGDSTEEFGVAALSLTDRSLRWIVAVLPAVSKDDPDRKRYENQIMHVVATTSTTVVVNVGGDAIHGVGWNVHTPGQVPRTIGLDAGTGKKLWEVPGTLTQLAAGDRLLAVRGTGPDDSRALALDPVTGKDLWQLPAGEPATWIAGDGDLGIVRTGVVGTLIGLADGTIGPTVTTNPGGLPQLGRFIQVISTGGAPSYAAWGSEGGDHRLVTLALSDPEALRAATAFSGHSLVVAGGGGYAWVKPTDGPDRVFAMDRTGAGRSDELDGFLRGIVGDLVITDGVDGTFAVHQYRPA